MSNAAMSFRRTHDSPDRRRRHADASVSVRAPKEGPPIAIVARQFFTIDPSSTADPRLAVITAGVGTSIVQTVTITTVFAAGDNVPLASGPPKCRLELQE
jgi:hypothetical protein